MAAQYAHLHIMTNNPTKYESYPANGYRGEAVTRTGLTDGQTDGRVQNIIPLTTSLRGV